MDLHLIEVAVLYLVCGKLQLPVAGAHDVLATIGLVFLPVVEVADQVNGHGIGCPFTEHPAFLCPVQAVIQVAGGKFGKSHLSVLREPVDHPLCMVMPSPNGFLVWLQP